MKCPLSNEGSDSSSVSKRVVLHLTESGVRKSSARRKKPKIFIQTTEEESSQEKKKWQEFFDSACDTSTDTETVRVLLASALEERSQKEAKKVPHTDSSEYPDDDVKELMSQIYQDLHNVATAQAFKTVCKEAFAGRFFIGEVSDIDELLQQVSVGVSSTISKSFAIPICATIANRLQNQRLPICKNPRGHNPRRFVIVASIQPTSGTVSWPLITVGSF